MASYWKSQPKKFCEVCKCWLGDNKATIEFHERGKTHQEKKRKQLDQIKKRGMQQAKDNAKADQYLEQMEAAAKKQFLQDLKEQGIKVTEDEYQKREQSTKAAIFKPVSMSGFNKNSSNVAFKETKPITELQTQSSSRIARFTQSKQTSSINQNSTKSKTTSSSQPYGKWTVVESNLETSGGQTFTPAKTEVAALQFTEKRVASGSLTKTSTEPIAFKKRKINSRSIRNKSDKD